MSKANESFSPLFREDVMRMQFGIDPQWSKVLTPSSNSPPLKKPKKPSGQHTVT